MFKALDGLSHKRFAPNLMMSDQDVIYSTLILSASYLDIPIINPPVSYVMPVVPVMPG